MSNPEIIKTPQEEVEVVKPNMEMLEILRVIVLVNQQIAKALCNPRFIVKDRDEVNNPR